MTSGRSINIEDLTADILRFAVILAIIGAAAISILSQNFRYLVPFYVVLGNATLGTYVFIRSRDKRIKTSFAAMTYFVAAWASSIFMYTQAMSAGDALFWSRMSSFFSSAVPSLFMYFVLVFPKEEKIHGFLTDLFLTAVTVAFFALSFTNLLVEGAFQTETGFRWSPGAGFIFFMMYFVGVMAFSFYVLFKKHGEYAGMSRMQIRYVLLGFFLGSGFPILTNIILPQIGVVEFSGWGPVSSIITIACIAYAIIRHRLMSIELVIQRGIIYAVVTAFIIAMYALAIILSEQFFRETLGYSSFVITAMSAIVIAILYQPVLKFLQEITDRIFFRGRYDYQKTLKEISSAIASIIRLDQLTKLIASTFTETMKVSEISFLLYEAGRKRFRSAQVELEGASRYRRMEIDQASPIIMYLKRTKEILVRDELEGRIKKSRSGEESLELNDLKEEMDRIGITLWVPIVLKDDVVGVIASGNKLSGEIFASEDLALLSTLANQTAVALDNVHLYEEILSMKTYNEDILKSLTNAVLTTDLRGKIITFNKMAEKVSGFSFREVINKNVVDVWGEGVLAGSVEGTLRGGSYSNHESSLIKKDGSVIPVSVTTTLLRDSKGTSIGVLLVASDLSEVKELESKVRQADKLAALGTMAAGMAHEIKNPLSSMKVLTQLMPKKFSDETFRERFTDIMPREISRIDRIVESLLGFARATAPKFEHLKLSSLIEETIKFYEDDIKNRNINLVKKFGDVPDIVADSGQLIQVFGNLILNALQAMPAGGQLVVEISEGQKREGVISSVKITVSDTGHGIPKEYLKKLFDPFFTTKHGGTGLGLTIAHSIVDGHRGSINVTSEINRGTTFTVTLPVAQ